MSRKRAIYPDTKIEISDPDENLNVEVRVIELRGPNSEEYKQALEIDQEYQKRIGREHGFTVYRIYRNVLHTIVLHPGGWLLNDKEWYPTLEAVQARIIDPENIGRCARTKRQTPEFFFYLPIVPSKFKVMGVRRSK